MSQIFTSIFYQPILNLLFLIYNYVPGHDLGLAIIILTIIIKLILWPFSQQSIKSQKALQEVQPKIDEIKKKFANNKEKMARATLEIYRENKVNPFSSCLPLLIQLPFFFAVFQVFRDFATNGQALSLIYGFVPRPEVINNFGFFGLVDLAKPNAVLAVLAGLAQFWQAKMTLAKKPDVKAPESQDENVAAMVNKQMLYMMPALTVIIGFTLPGGLSLYWLTITLLTGLQQVIVFKKTNSAKGDKVIEGEVIK